MKLLRLSHTGQKGLTMLEMIIALSLTVLFIGAVVSSLGQSQYHAEMIQNKMHLAQIGLQRLQTDMPCGITKLSGLMLRDDATAGLCGDTNDLNRWGGPYMEPGDVLPTNGDLQLNAIVPGVSMSVKKISTPVDFYTIVQVDGLNPELRATIVARCGDDCLPLKNISGDITTVGLMVSNGKVPLVNNETYDVNHYNRN